jgi:hypothetical protein
MAEAEAGGPLEWLFGDLEKPEACGVRSLCPAS